MKSSRNNYNGKNINTRNKNKTKNNNSKIGAITQAKIKGQHQENEL